MSSSLEIIDAYFTNQLPAEERQRFEKRCEEDPDFAREVSFYISTRAQLNQTMKQQKAQSFRNLHEELSSRRTPAGMSRNITPYFIAAAASILIFVLIIMNRHDSAESLADAYIEQNFTQLSVTMGAQDSLQLAIDAFNKKEFEQAERIFEALDRRYVDLASETTKYLGITNLIKGNYDKAIEQFDKLAADPDLYANPGKFYGALARMKRSAEGDIENARTLLNEVAAKKLPGEKEARAWIDRL